MGFGWDLVSSPTTHTRPSLASNSRGGVITFLDLPAELRNMIYKSVLTSRMSLRYKTGICRDRSSGRFHCHVILADDDEKAPFPLFNQIQNVNKQFRYETRNLEWRLNNISFPSEKDYLVVLRRMENLFDNPYVLSPTLKQQPMTFVFRCDRMLVLETANQIDGFFVSAIKKMEHLCSLYPRLMVKYILPTRTIRSWDLISRLSEREKNPFFFLLKDLDLHAATLRNGGLRIIFPELFRQDALDLDNDALLSSWSRQEAGFTNGLPVHYNSSPLIRDDAAKLRLNIKFFPRDLEIKNGRLMEWYYEFHGKPILRDISNDIETVLHDWRALYLREQLINFLKNWIENGL